MTRLIPLSRAAAALAAVGAVALGASPASAQGQPAPQATSEQVYAALGLADMPAEYVVVVDTSRSMAENGRYASVREGLRTFLGGLRPIDRFTLITFDAYPHVVYHGQATSPEVAMAEMPLEATGGATDIGAALNDAVKTLEAPASTVPAALVLFTDDISQPLADSRFADPNGAAWRGLEQRGRALAERVTGYAIPTEVGETGADDLRRTIPDTTVLSLSTPDQVASFLSSLTLQFRRSVAAARLDADLMAGASASWTDPQEDADLVDGVDITVTLRSNTSALPLEVVGPELSALTVPVAVTGLPALVALAPGEAKQFPVTVRAKTGPGFGDAETAVRAGLRLTARATTPWHDVLTGELVLPGEAPRVDTAKSWPATIGAGPRPWLVIGAPGLAVVALASAGVWLWHRRHPYLSGSLVATTADDVSDYHSLEGVRSLRFRRVVTRTSAEPPGEFRVRGVWVDGALLPQVSFLRDDRTTVEPRVCVPGYPIDAYGVLMLYTGPKGQRG